MFSLFASIAGDGSKDMDSDLDAIADADSRGSRDPRVDVDRSAGPQAHAQTLGGSVRVQDGLIVTSRHVTECGLLGNRWRE